MKSLILTTILLGLGLIGCVPPKFGTQYYHAPGFSMKETNGKVVGIAVLGSGMVEGYEKGFTKVYKDKAGFTSHLSAVVAEALRSRGVEAGSVDLTDGQKADISKEINTHILDWNKVPDHVQQAVTSICERNDLEYLIVLTQWQISGEWEYRQGMMMPAGGGGSMRPTSSSAKMCYVTLEGAILGKDGRVRYYGQSFGSAEVKLFAFKAGLKKGVNDAVDKFAMLLTGDIASKNLNNNL